MSDYDDEDRFGYMDDDYGEDRCEGCDQVECQCVECGLMPDGQCVLAGTEHCDWDCGALNDQRIAAMKSKTE